MSPTPQSESEFEEHDGDSPGVHVDGQFMKGLRTELEGLQAELLSENLKALFERWSENCDCRIDGDAEGDVYSDDDDLRYCWNGDYKDRRTCHALQSLLPLMEKTLSAHVDLIERTKERAAASRRKLDLKRVRRSRIAEVMEEISEFGSEVGSDAMLLDNIRLAENDPRSRSMSPNPPGVGLMDLPPELLADIILIAKRSDHRLPLRFSHISVPARRFTLKTPSLWNFISIGYSVNHIALHIARSFDTPLEVSIFPPYDRPASREQPTRRLQRFLASLSPHHHRIRSLHADVDAREAGIATLMYVFLFNSNLMNLEVLDIGVHAELCKTTTAPDSQYAGKGWSVRDLCLRGVQVSSSSRFFSVNLTRLELRGYCQMSGPELVAVLINTPRLRELVLQDFDLRNSSEAYPPAAPLPGLLALSFSRVTTHHVAEILSRISTPTVKHLTFMYRSQRDPELPAPAEHPLLTASKSNPQLESLDITQSDLSADEWSQLFQNLPNLQYLRIASSMLEDSHLAPLHSDPASFCPKLDSLVLDNELFLTTFVLRTVVEARRNNQRVPAIRSVVLRGWDFSNVDDEDVVALQSMVPCFLLKVFVPEYDPVYQEAGSSDEMGWSGQQPGSEGVESAGLSEDDESA